VNFSFFLQLALPLEGEIGRADNQHAVSQAAQLQFAQQQTRHDGLAGAGIVGEQEADAGGLQQIVVNRFQLVKQGIDPRDRQAEVGVEFVGDAQRVGLQPEPDQVAIAGIGVGGLLTAEGCNLFLGERNAAE